MSDQKTNNFLVSLISSRAFIGGTQDSAGQWSWTDWSPFIFTHWAPGNPSGDGKVLEMVNEDGTINDLSDSSQRSAICQQNASPDSEASSDVTLEVLNKKNSDTDLYDRNLTVVNMSNFKFIINDDICDVQNLSLVTIIHSATQNSETRDIIRLEQGQYQNNLQYIFLLIHHAYLRLKAYKYI